MAANTYDGEPCKNGHAGERYANGQCVECKKQRDRERYWADREKTRERNRRWREANPKRKAATRAAWRAANPEYGKRYNAERRRRLAHAQPRWADQAELDRWYAELEPGMQVDHVIPLMHPRVCGLHVPANLQYLTKDANGRKGARFDPDDAAVSTMATAILGDLA